MFTNSTSPTPRGWGGCKRLLSTVSLVVLSTGCSSLLDVKNPNNVNEGDLNNPAVAAALANGALSATARAWGNVLTPYSEATDELTWIGSRDAWSDLDQGYLSGITNEFVDAAFPQVAQARRCPMRRSSGCGRSTRRVPCRTEATWPALTSTGP